jgi:hypothetical protein
MRYGPMLLPTSWIGVAAMCVSERPHDHTCAIWRRAGRRVIQQTGNAHRTSAPAPTTRGPSRANTVPAARFPGAS